jgi:hypothetical protein
MTHHDDNAHVHRLSQAEQLLRQAGFVELPDGGWAPPDDALSPGASEKSEDSD